MGVPKQLNLPPVILLVEPNLSLSSLISSLLGKEGYSVLVAPGAGEALALCKDISGIRLIIMHVVLPDGSGVDFAARASELHVGAKILYLSGVAEQELRDQGIGDEARVLVKPLALSDLVTLVNELLRDA